MSHRWVVGALAGLSLAVTACTSGHPNEPLPTGSSAVARTAPVGSATVGPRTKATGESASFSRPASTEPVKGRGPAGPSSGPNVPAGFRPYSVTFISVAEGWVLGTAPCPAGSCGSMLRTNDGGRSWAGVPAPHAQVGDSGSSPAGGLDLLRFADQRDGWAAGPSLFATHDGGASWHAISFTPRIGAISSLATSGGYVYALVNDCRLHWVGNCLASTALYAAAIDSDRWTQVTAQLPQDENLNHVVTAGGYWFVPSAHGLLRGRGTTESTPRPGPPCPRESEPQLSPALTLAMVDPNHLDAVCEGGPAARSATYQLYGTSDGGASWIRSGGSHLEASAVGGIADNGAGVMALAVYSGGSAILRTTDDGMTLHDAGVSAPTGGLPWTDLGFTTSSQGVVVLEDSGLYVSRDAGRSWSPVHF